MDFIDQSGSTIIEAALVFPLVILITALILSSSFSVFRDVDEFCDGHRSETREKLADGLADVEDIIKLESMYSDDNQINNNYIW